MQSWQNSCRPSQLRRLILLPTSTSSMQILHWSPTCVSSAVKSWNLLILLGVNPRCWSGCWKLLRISLARLKTSIACTLNIIMFSIIVSLSRKIFWRVAIMSIILLLTSLRVEWFSSVFCCCRTLTRSLFLSISSENLASASTKLSNLMCKQLLLWLTLSCKCCWNIKTSPGSLIPRRSSSQSWKSSRRSRVISSVDF